MCAFGFDHVATFLVSKIVDNEFSVSRNGYSTCFNYWGHRGVDHLAMDVLSGLCKGNSFVRAPQPPVRDPFRAPFGSFLACNAM